MSPAAIARSLALFAAAGLAEVGGGYLDAADIAGALVCLAGVGIIMYWPRS
jgi:drug/metabolite transporter superfamily protein YnfA